MLDILCSILKFCRYAYSVLALNFTLAMGTSSVPVSRCQGTTKQQSQTHRICCQRPGIALPYRTVSIRSCQCRSDPSTAQYDDAPSTALFDLGNVELEEVVQPCDEFLSVSSTMLGTVTHVGRRFPA